MIPYTNQMREYDVSYAVKRGHHKGDKTKKYTKSIMIFDIEVTSAWIENNKVIGYRTGESSEEYWNNLTPIALPYIWQFSCDGTVYYGREFRDFKKVLDDLPTDIELIIWVHNLSYEFQFLCNIVEWKSVFARTPHKPIKCVPKEYPNIEFRCSYMLTRLSLDSWGKSLGFEKATGDLDYEIIRTPFNRLNETELNYCERDCLVVEKGIQKYVEQYGLQKDIPLTQTGTVRKVVKELLTTDKEYVKYIKKLVPRSAREYKMLQNIFAGGYTHANRKYSGTTIRGHIEHYDFASSYPTVMLAEKYPMWKFSYVPLNEIPIEKFEDNAYIFYLKFEGITCQTFNTYIQASKCVGKGMIFDNGRVVKADELYMWLTEQDYLTISETYKWKKLEIVYSYSTIKGYLPHKFLRYILELYGNKTTLKDVPEQEDLYAQSKQYINSLFGMCVTALVQSDVEYHDGVWNVTQLTAEYVDEKLAKMSDWKKHDKKVFLSYAWGCWVTAYARRNLWKCIEYCDSDLLYTDTDSIFVKGEYDFSWYNNEITEKIKESCKFNDLDFEATRPKTIKGKEKPLGIFEREDNCTEFRTLGAKRYVERRESDNKLHLTVSGINKEAVELLCDDIDTFQDEFNFDKDAPCVKKRLLTYINDMPVVTFPDGYVSTYKYGINMRRNGYKLTMTDEYKKLINYHDIFTDLPEQFIISMRGKFTL